MDMEEALWKKNVHMLIFVGDKARIRHFFLKRLVTYNIIKIRTHEEIAWLSEGL